VLLLGSVFVACLFAAVAPGPAAEPAKPIRVGLIGLDTSHVIAFTQIINNPKNTGDLADIRVVAGYPGGSPDLPDSWNRVKGYTEQLRKSGVEIVPSIDELLKEVDAVMIESVDGRPHLAQARPVIAARKPLFIDKPMAASLADVLEIFRLAKEAGVPVFSASSLRWGAGCQAARSGQTFGEVRKCTAWSPMSIEPHHPDLFWYGVHGVEILFTIMGPGCQTVTRVGRDKVVGHWAGGREGTFEARKDYGAEVVGTRSSGLAGKYDGYKPLVVEVARFFKTGKPPVAAEETIEIFAFMEAADESKRQGGAPVSIKSVLAKARQTAASR
jgi:hypothetical protein